MMYLSTLYCLYLYNITSYHISLFNFISIKLNLTFNFFIIFKFHYSTEIRAAEQRALAFARRIWSDTKIGNNKELLPLLTIRIISSLARWFFNVLGRHLISFRISDLRGT